MMEHAMRSGKPGARVFKIIGWVILGVLGAAGIAILLGYVVMLLWNWLMPLLFGLTEINFWMAAGIFLLSKLIFGGFGHGGPHDKHHDKFKNKHLSLFKRCTPKGEHFHKWKYYDEYWKEEGEKAFDDYVETKKGE